MSLPPASVCSPPQGDEDPTQLLKMLNGENYIAKDAYLDRLKENTADLLHEFNGIRNTKRRMEVMRKFCIFEGVAEGEIPDVCVVNPFTCEYGFTITFGNEVFVGPNSTFADVGPITIGSRTAIGPNAQFYTPTHPLSPEERNGSQGPESAKPIKIGSDCWLGGGVIVVPGVTIGDGSTIGAGTVVTKDVPPRSVVVGNPGRVIKRIEKDGTVVNVK